jgi:hypothetical protein
VTEQFRGRLGHQGIPIRLSSTDHGPEEGCQDLFARGGDAPPDPFGDARVSGQELMTALMSQDRFEGEVPRVRVALERLGINS